ncbi:Polysaccharide biosynthesis protein [Flavobacterium longum]
MKRLIDKATGHLSLVIIILGAACFFAANILLKEVLSEQAYGQYSIAITYFSIIYMYGLLGSEQLFLRFSHHIGPNTITTQRFQKQLIICVILITSVLATVFFAVGYGHATHCSIVMLYLSSLGIIGLLYLFNIFRLNGQFVFAQFLSNFWKIVLVPIAVLWYFKWLAGLPMLIDILMAAIIISVAIALFVFFRRIQFVYDESVSRKETLTMFFHQFISISAFSLLMFGDRFIIERKFGVAGFGNYFYLTNFFLAPFSILQNYVGFKQLVFFKKHFTMTGFDALNRKILLFSLAMGIGLYFLPAIVGRFVRLNFDFGRYQAVILLLLILGVARLYSASILSAFEAKTTVKTLQKANLIFIGLAGLIIGLAFLFFNALEWIILAMILIWLFRSILLRQLLLKIVNQEPNH